MGTMVCGWDKTGPQVRTHGRPVPFRPLHSTRRGRGGRDAHVAHGRRSSSPHLRGRRGVARRVYLTTGVRATSDTRVTLHLRFTRGFPPRGGGGGGGVATRPWPTARPRPAVTTPSPSCPVAIAALLRRRRRHAATQPPLFGRLGLDVRREPLLPRSALRAPALRAPRSAVVVLLYAARARACPAHAALSLRMRRAVAAACRASARFPRSTHPEIVSERELVPCTRTRPPMRRPRPPPSSLPARRRPSSSSSSSSGPRARPPMRARSLRVGAGTRTACSTRAGGRT